MARPARRPVKKKKTTTKRTSVSGTFKGRTSSKSTVKGRFSGTITSKKKKAPKKPKKPAKPKQPKGRAPPKKPKKPAKPKQPKDKAIAIGKSTGPPERLQARPGALRVRWGEPGKVYRRIITEHPSAKARKKIKKSRETIEEYD